jgi:hypothetical protein
MQDALLYVGAGLSLLALVLLLVKPLWGLLAIFIARPIVDTTWAQSLVFDFKLTELVSTLVPLIVFARMFVDADDRRPLRDMPLKWIWLVWSADVLIFSSNIMLSEDWRAGLQALMRHLNGVAGFYMVQAYCRSDEDFLRFSWAMAIAGFFPMATGVIEGVTGRHWSITLGEDNVIRNIGLYHDAITIRYYALQTLMSLLLIMSLKKRSAAVTLFCFGYGLAAVFVIKGAYSKSGVLTLGAWVILWPILRRSAKGVMSVAVTACIVALYFSKEIMNSIGFVFTKEIAAVQGTGGVEHAFAGRWYLWTGMLNEWRSLDPVAQVFGAGHLAIYAHNDYLQILFHGGLAGLAIYLTLLCAVGWAIMSLVFKKADIWAIAALFAFIMWIVDTMGLVPSAYSGYQWFVWGTIGFCLRRRRDPQFDAEDVAVPARSPRFANLLGAV